MLRVKHADARANPSVAAAADQTFHILALFLTALLVAADEPPQAATLRLRCSWSSASVLSDRAGARRLRDRRVQRPRARHASTPASRSAGRAASRRRTSIVVQIDDVTFQDLDRRWPFPRALHGKVIDAHRAPTTRARSPTTSSSPSAPGRRRIALLEAIARRTARWCSPRPRSKRGGRTKILGGDAVLKEVGARPGNGVLPPGPGRRDRRVPYAVDGLESSRWPPPRWRPGSR